MKRKIATIDFETHRINKRPDYPPKPVGVSITYPDNKTEYLAFGHLSDNNCTKAEAKRKLKLVYKDYIVNAHNGKFDFEVAEKHLGLPLVPPNGWHDSMLLAFLYSPRAWSLKLKPLADKYLNMPPVEQDELHDWILSHVFTSQKSGEGDVILANKKPKGCFKIPPSKTGGFIAYAPTKMVSKYAKGDTIRSHKLTKLFLKDIIDRGMAPQYEIEKRVIIKAIEMEREGVPIDYRLLEPELLKANKQLKKHQQAMIKIVGDINFNSGQQIVEAFESKGLVREWEHTDKGNPMTGVESLMKVCTDKVLVGHLDLFSKYSKLIGTYMTPWLESALENNGRFFPWFNTIKGDNDKGTYTGRFSSNFQQVPREPLKDYKSLPFLRNFIIADNKTHTLFNRDFMGQELRILGHFGDSVLLDAYNNDPLLNGHAFVGELVKNATGDDYPKSSIKGCNFLMVYGGGANALSNTLKIPMDEAKLVMAAHSKALPEVKELKDTLNAMADNDEFFKTAGGRWYDFEAGKEFVALNTLIQGSAADHTKRALLTVDDVLKSRDYDARLMLQVHDELMLSGQRRLKKRIMADFKEAMEYDELFDLPMCTDGKIGDRWGSMEPVK